MARTAARQDVLRELMTWLSRDLPAPMELQITTIEIFDPLPLDWVSDVMFATKDLGLPLPLLQVWASASRRGSLAMQLHIAQGLPYPDVILRRTGRGGFDNAMAAFEVIKQADIDAFDAFDAFDEAIEEVARCFPDTVINDIAGYPWPSEPHRADANYYAARGLAQSNPSQCIDMLPVLDAPYRTERLINSVCEAQAAAQAPMLNVDGFMRVIEVADRLPHSERASSFYAIANALAYAEAPPGRAVAELAWRTGTHGSDEFSRCVPDLVIATSSARPRRVQELIDVFADVHGLVGAVHGRVG